MVVQPVCNKVSRTELIVGGNAFSSFNVTREYYEHDRDPLIPQKPEISTTIINSLGGKWWVGAYS